MIRYALTCDQGHDFDSWFQSAGTADALLAEARVACVVCGSPQVSKAPMAPALSLRVRKGKSAPEGAAGGAAPPPDLSAPANPLEAAIAAMRRHIEENSEYVGMNFAAEARAIHAGEAPERSIHGEARGDEARRLIEEGIPVAPLPFMPARRLN
ncbi:MAG: DUF1178 family protein [Rhodobacteraceae bacterium]|nr:DUF1178 family protein [Paracoccaceae bacterium]